MDAVVKVGGSLAKHPRKIKDLCRKLERLGKTYRILIVPGGGPYADLVRVLDERYVLSDTISHKMAILAMDQFGLLLLSEMSEARAVHTLEETKTIIQKGKLPIFLPSRLIFLEDPLEHSWNVTSDSIAAYIASLLNVNKLILIKDVDGIFPEDPKKGSAGKLIERLSAVELLSWNSATCVDKTLPAIILKSQLDCFVVNGTHPERVKAILDGVETLCTRIER